MVVQFKTLANGGQGLGEKVFSQAYIQLTQTMNDLWRDYKLSLPWVPLNINKAASDPPKPALNCTFKFLKKLGSNPKLGGWDLWSLTWGLGKAVTHTAFLNKKISKRFAHSLFQNLRLSQSLPSTHKRPSLKPTHQQKVPFQEPLVNGRVEERPLRAFSPDA